MPTTLGIALVDAYDSMDLEQQLSKPELRAKVLLTIVLFFYLFYLFFQMEADMVAISKGIRTKQEVLDDNIRMYKQIFMKVTEECLGIMDEVTTSILFSPPKNWPLFFP